MTTQEWWSSLTGGGRTSLPFLRSCFLLVCYCINLRCFALFLFFLFLYPRCAAFEVKLKLPALHRHAQRQLERI